jgi:hypothetical protein
MSQLHILEKWDISGQMGHARPASREISVLRGDCVARSFAKMRHHGGIRCRIGAKWDIAPAARH